VTTRPSLVALHTALSVLGLLAVATLDHITGTEIRIFPLYFVPIAWAAQNGPVRLTTFMVVASTVAWLVAARLSGLVYSQSYVWPVNVLSQLVAFASIGVLLVTLKRRLAREVAMSREDGLTGLLNLRGFSEEAKGLLARMERSGRPAVFAYIDLDNFKAVNDQHGHDAGDRALTEVAGVLRSGTRKGDVVGRLGGDEFVVALHDVDLELAGEILERLRVSLVAKMRGRGWPITASVGALLVASPAPTLDEVLRVSDDLMYSAKGAGKNRVIARDFRAQVLA
jgi:diguanylate cyclase (GGDEF)-like protein